MKVTSHILCTLQERNLSTLQFSNSTYKRKRNNYVYTYTHLSLYSSRTLFTGKIIKNEGYKSYLMYFTRKKFEYFALF